MGGDIATNRKGYRDFHIRERIEAGIELRGTEVKSIRAGGVDIAGAFARVENGEVFVYGMGIPPYERASHEQHEPKRVRRLLLHRREIERLFEASNIKGNAILPLRLYWKGGLVKVELGIGKGKDKVDRREDLKEKAVQREVERVILAKNKRR
ncbi:MAG: SsrA-binding protein SmpB [Chthoniobacterales bacterium]|nr:SsrA-binding protein SmpB [Chthoniobacterales bacterium]